MGAGPRIELGPLGYEANHLPLIVPRRMEEGGGIEPLWLITIPLLSRQFADRSAAPSATDDDENIERVSATFRLTYFRLSRQHPVRPSKRRS